MAHIHNSKSRMPVILPKAQENLWIGGRGDDAVGRNKLACGVVEPLLVNAGKGKRLLGFEVDVVWNFELGRGGVPFVKPVAGTRQRLVFTALRKLGFSVMVSLRAFSVLVRMLLANSSFFDQRGINPQ